MNWFFALSLLVIGCSQEMAGPERTTRLGNYNDAQILEITNLIHQGEIELAQLAIARGTYGDVRSFAEQVAKVHREAKERSAVSAGEVGLRPTSSERSREQHKHNEAVLRDLRATTGTTFDRAYVEALVDGHQEVLDIIEDELLPDARNLALETELRTLQSAVSAYLARAKQLEADLP